MYIKKLRKNIITDNLIKIKIKKSKNIKRWILK